MAVLTVAAMLATLALRSGVRARSAADRQGIALPGNQLLGRIGSFELTDQTGARFGSNDLAGRYYIADFIFTSCAGVCPTMTSAMAELERQFADDDRVRFVSITVDPDTDTPERLAEYAARFGAAPDRWHFLTGPTAEIETLARDRFMLGSGDEPINHSSRFVLVDDSGGIRGYFDGTDAESVAILRSDLARLLAENTP
jgi:protein SCO1/2